MVFIIREIKRWIKARKKLFQLTLILYRYLFPPLYGYIRSKFKVNVLYRKLERKYPAVKRITYNPKKQNQFVIIGPKDMNNVVRKAVFGDIELGQLGNYDCSFYITHTLKNKSKQKVHDLYFKINRWIPLPGKNYWGKQYTTNNIKLDYSKNIFVIFSPGFSFEESFSQPVLWDYIYNASEKTFCKRILYLVDPIDKIPKIKYWFRFFDVIAGSAYEDSKKYGINFIDTPCVKYPIIPNKVYYDIYIRVQDVGREKLINDCYQYLRKKGVKCQFYIYKVEKDNMFSKDGMIYVAKSIPYTEMLEEELAANVLLEVVVPGLGSGATLRYYEAVMYGKKLLTNNPTVKNLDFYDERFIHYFEKPEDIDVEWVQKQENVDFHYDNEFSTVSFCKKIEQMEMMI